MPRSPMAFHFLALLLISTTVLPQDTPSRPLFTQDSRPASQTRPPEVPPKYYQNILAAPLPSGGQRLPLPAHSLSFELRPQKGASMQPLEQVEWLHSIGTEKPSLKKKSWVRVDPPYVEVTGQMNLVTTGSFKVILTPQNNGQSMLSSLETNCPTLKLRPNISLPKTVTQTQTVLVEFEFLPESLDSQEYLIFVRGKANTLPQIFPVKFISKVKPSTYQTNLHSVHLYLDDEETHEKVLWLKNNSKDSIKITRTESSLRYCTHEWPWRDSKTKIIKSMESHPTFTKSYDPEAISPTGHWLVPPGKVRAMLFLTLPKISDREIQLRQGTLLEKGIITLEAEKGPNSRDLILKVPLFIWKRESSPFFSEDAINLGLVCSEEVTPQYTLKIGNQLGEPAVITKVEIIQEADSMIKVYSSHRFMIPLPPHTPKFDLLKLALFAPSDTHIFFSKGIIKISIDISGIIRKYEIPFHGSYLQNLLGSSRNFKFQTKKVNTTDATIHLSYNGFFNLNYFETIQIEKMELQAGKKGAPFKLLSRLREGQLVRLGRTRAFELQVSYPRRHLEQNFTHDYSLLKVFIYGQQALIPLKIYSRHLLCRVQSMVHRNKFHKCVKESLNFQKVGVHNYKDISIDLVNPSDTPILLKRYTSNMRNGSFKLNLEVRTSLEPQARIQMTQVGLKEMWNYQLLPRAQITLKLIILPNIQGSFQKGLTIETSTGSIFFSIKYQAFQGGLVVTPSSLRFDIFFPGGGPVKTVSTKNKYKTAVRLLGAYSPNSLVRTDLQRSILNQNEKTPVIKVSVDLQTFERTRKQPPYYLRQSVANSVTLADLYSLKRQQEAWEELLKQGMTEINSEIYFQSNIQNEIKVQVRGSVRRLQLIKETRLTTGFREEGKVSNLDITFQNPTEGPIAMQFFVATDRMIRFSELQKKARTKLIDTYSSISDDRVCISHSDIKVEDLEYFAKTMFKGSSLATSQSHKDYNKVCFLVDEENPELALLANRTILEVTHKEQDKHIFEHEETFVIKDVLLYSRTEPQIKPEKYWGMSYLDKMLLVIKKKLKSLAAHPREREDTRREGDQKEQKSKQEGDQDGDGDSQKSGRESSEGSYSQSDKNDKRQTNQSNKGQEQRDSVKEGQKTAQESSTSSSKGGKTSQKSLLTALSQEDLKSALSTQEFFIHPDFQRAELILKPKEQRRIPVVSYLPRNIDDSRVVLLIKNNVTDLIHVPIIGQSGSPDLIVSRVHSETFTGLNKEAHPPLNRKRLVFKLSAEDFHEHNYFARGMPTSPKHFTKIYELKNIGKMPLKVLSVNIDKRGCYSNGITINSCEGFTLQPNETHSFWIGFFPVQHAASKITRKVYFISMSSVIWLPLDIDAPIELISDAATPRTIQRMRQFFLVKIIFLMVMAIFFFYRTQSGSSENISFWSIQSLAQENQEASCHTPGSDTGLEDAQLSQSRNQKLENDPGTTRGTEEQYEMTPEERKAFLVKEISKKVTTSKNGRFRRYMSITKIMRQIPEASNKYRGRKHSKEQDSDRMVGSPCKHSPSKQVLQSQTDQQADQEPNQYGRKPSLESSSQNEKSKQKRKQKRNRKERRKQKRMDRILENLDLDEPLSAQTEITSNANNASGIDRDDISGQDKSSRKESSRLQNQSDSRENVLARSGTRKGDLSDSLKSKTREKIFKEDIKNEEQQKQQQKIVDTDAVKGEEANSSHQVEQQQQQTSSYKQQDKREGDNIEPPIKKNQENFEEESSRNLDQKAQDLPRPQKVVVKNDDPVGGDQATLEIKVNQEEETSKIENNPKSAKKVTKNIPKKDKITSSSKESKKIKTPKKQKSQNKLPKEVKEENIEVDEIQQRGEDDDHIIDERSLNLSKVGHHRQTSSNIGDQNASFAVGEDLEKGRPPNLQSIVDQNISAITHNYEDPNSDTSKLDTFIKGSADDNSRGGSSEEDSLSEDYTPSGESDLEKSTEKIRQFVGMAEDIHENEPLHINDVSNPNIGTIGSRPKPPGQGRIGAIGGPQQRNLETEDVEMEGGQPLPSSFNNFQPAGQIGNSIWGEAQNFPLQNRQPVQEGYGAPGLGPLPGPNQPPYNQIQNEGGMGGQTIQPPGLDQSIPPENHPQMGGQNPSGGNFPYFGGYQGGQGPPEYPGRQNIQQQQQQQQQQPHYPTQGQFFQPKNPQPHSGFPYYQGNNYQYGEFYGGQQSQQYPNQGFFGNGNPQAQAPLLPPPVGTQQVLHKQELIQQQQQQQQQRQQMPLPSLQNPQAQQYGAYPVNQMHYQEGYYNGYYDQHTPPHPGNQEMQGSYPNGNNNPQIGGQSFNDYYMDSSGGRSGNSSYQNYPNQQAGDPNKYPPQPNSGGYLQEGAGQYGQRGSPLESGNWGNQSNGAYQPGFYQSYGSQEGPEDFSGLQNPPDHRNTSFHDQSWSNTENLDTSRQSVREEESFHNESTEIVRPPGLFDAPPATNNAPQEAEGLSNPQEPQIKGGEEAMEEDRAIGSIQNNKFKYLDGLMKTTKDKSNKQQYKLFHQNN